MYCGAAVVDAAAEISRWSDLCAGGLGFGVFGRAELLVFVLER